MEKERYNLTENELDMSGVARFRKALPIACTHGPLMQVTCMHIDDRINVRLCHALRYAHACVWVWAAGVHVKAYMPVCLFNAVFRSMACPLAVQSNVKRCTCAW
jgi:hypothetical protein